MPRQIPTAQLDTIVEVVAKFPSGASAGEIRRQYKPTLPHRTLQRWLARLVEEGRLTKKGRGPSTRYLVNSGGIEVRPSTAQIKLRAHATEVEHYVPITAEAASIKQAVRQPIHNRKPISYDRSFLDRYEPNVSHYLSTQTRDELMEIGRAQENNLPAGTYAKQILNRILIDLSWNSSRLEGNTYSLLETERLLELGEATEGKEAHETQMILNHKAAIELFVEQAEEIGFNRYTILNLHALLADNLLPDSRNCGRLRRRGVGIGGTVYNPLEIPQLIEECFEQILEKAEAISDPFEQSFFSMVHLPYLQPFEDVNKRVSRLAANIPFIRHNLCPLSFVDVPKQAYVDGLLGIYELNRIELFRDVFLWAYQRSCAKYSAVRESLGEPDDFRLRYRSAIGYAISDIVSQRMDKKTAAKFIRNRTVQDVPKQDQARFSEIVETELSNLHEGNIARYKLRPSQFDEWRSIWQ
jgi:hypothetical protein